MSHNPLIIVTTEDNNIMASFSNISATHICKWSLAAFYLKQLDFIWWNMKMVPGLWETTLHKLTPIWSGQIKNDYFVWVLFNGHMTRSIRAQPNWLYSFHHELKIKQWLRDDKCSECMRLSQLMIHFPVAWTNLIITLTLNTFNYCELQQQE